MRTSPSYRAATSLLLVFVAHLAGCEGSQAAKPEPASRASAAQGAATETPTPESPPSVVGPSVNEYALAFGKEGRDAVWAAAQEAELARAVSTVPGARTNAVDCRTTICRLEIVHDSGASMNTFTSPFLVALKMNRYSRLFETNQAALTTTAYITRDGYGSPKADGTAVKWP